MVTSLVGDAEKPGVETVPWWRTGLGEAEVERVVAAIRGERITMGAETILFEEELAEALGVAHAVATPSGSVALLLSLQAHGSGTGDEVIVPARTFVAPAHAIQMAGATPIVVDTLADTPLIDPEAVEAAITPRTKAIIPVHLNGRAAAVGVLRQLATKHDCVVIEDACQALFSRDDRGYLGTRGDVGCFSFGVAKLLTTGYGGAIVCDDAATYERLVALRNHGIPGGTAPHGHEGFGFNFKFSDIMAAIGREQLRSAPRPIERVTAIHNIYSESLRELPYLDMLPVDTEAGAIPIYAEVMSPERAALRDFLENRGIHCQGLAASLHRFPHLGATGEFPNAERFDREAFVLPCGPTQPLESVGRVIDVLRQFMA
ncbi:MAG: DegT/DnrJ/EryC1/StrS family aminotransferase [Planctomycetota bacterium]